MNKWLRSFEFKKWIFLYLLILAGVISFFCIANFDTVVAGFSRLSRYLSPFISGLIIAYLLGIPNGKLKNFLANRKNAFVSKRANGLSVLVTFTTLLLIVGVVLGSILPAAVRSLTDLINYFPAYFENTKAYLHDLGETHEWAAELGVSTILDDVSVRTILTSAAVTDFISLEITDVWKSLVSLLGVSTYLLNVLLAVISSIYFMLEMDTIVRFVSRLGNAFLSEKTVKFFSRYLTNSNRYFRQFLSCNFLDGLIVGVVSTLGLAIMRCRYAPLLGPMLGVFNLIPYFGSIVGTLIAVLIVLFTDSPTHAIISGIFLLILQQIDGNVIKPKLFGDSMELSALLVIMSITIGGAYFGVAGMVIAVPLAAVGKNIVSDILDYRAHLKDLKTKQAEWSNKGVEL